MAQRKILHLCKILFFKCCFPDTKDYMTEPVRPDVSACLTACLSELNYPQVSSNTRPLQYQSVDFFCLSVIMGLMQIIIDREAGR